MKAVTAQRREGRRTSGGVTYASRLGDGGRTARGGWEAPLDPHITQHVQQYLSIRTFYVTHTQAGNMLDMHTHTHTIMSREKDRGREREREQKQERAVSNYHAFSKSMNVSIKPITSASEHQVSGFMIIHRKQQI